MLWKRQVSGSSQLLPWLLAAVEQPHYHSCGHNVYLPIDGTHGYLCEWGFLCQLQLTCSHLAVYSGLWSSSQDWPSTWQLLLDEYEQNASTSWHSATCEPVCSEHNYFQFNCSTQLPSTWLRVGVQLSEVAIKLPLLSRMTGLTDTIDCWVRTSFTSKFGVSGSSFHLSKVEDGCIAVIWLCSTTEVAVKAAQDGHKYRSHLFTPDHGDCCRCILWRGGVCVGMLSLCPHR